MSDKKLVIRIDKGVKFKNEYNKYSLQLCHPHRPWWLLLLLIPFLLFIKCNKDISVACIEPEGNVVIDDVPVTLKYTTHFLWHNGKFLANDSISLTQNTDENGNTTFKDLPCCVYSYIFYCLSQASFTAKSGCHAVVDEERNFHYTRHVDLMMQPRRENLQVLLLDRETGDELPSGTLIYKYEELGVEKTDSAKADARGIATLPQMRYCSTIKEMIAQCYGYADTSRVYVPCQDLLNPTDSMAMRLRPIKDRFEFFVKNKETKQPIPGANCVVTLTHPGKSKTTDMRNVQTSQDGKGMAFYDDAFILSTIAIHANALHYKDGDLEGRLFSVEDFQRQDEDTRTVWLVPEPYMEEFVNVDSINGKPIAGVENTFKVIYTDGTSSTEKVISNSNGVFTIKAKEDDRIEIISIRRPEYEDKTSVYPKFVNIKDKKVRMQPNLVDLNFQTVKNISGQPVLPNCKLVAQGSISGSLQPNNSGSTGSFTVKARVNENLSITASKGGYATNSTTVKNELVSNLKGGRKIPLKPDPVIYENSSGPRGTTKDCYDLKDAPCDFLFEWKLCDACTMLIVTDTNGSVLGRFGRNDPAGHGGGIQYTLPQGSKVLHSSTQTVCVTRTDVNGDPCWYRISKK